jgi:bifunctional pyridoxal-dependent enzyme with beta-cystathionase and maltose regulon repressor activities
LETLFGKTDIKPRWGVNIELQMAQPIHESLLAQISKSVFGYAYNPYSFMMLKKMVSQKLQEYIKN